MKHTPGPWVAQQRSNSMIDIHHSSGSVKGAITLALCRVQSRDSWIEESKANAKLIASAPVMLDRLTLIENLATQVCDAINKRDAIAYEETLSSIKMLAREAIVEATDKGYHSFNQRGNSV